MKFKNPLKHLEPQQGDQMIEVMQGAFWTMLTFMIFNFLLKWLSILYVLIHWRQFN